MSEKKKVIVMVCVFAAVIVAAVIAYNVLSKNVASPNLQVVGESTPTPQESAETVSRPSVQVEEEEGQVARGDTDKVAAPDFIVQNADGQEISLSDMKGNPVVLNFWASWCPPCKGEMPEFQTVWEEVGSDVEFMMVDMVDGQRETMQTGSAYIEEQGYTFPVYYDVSQEAAIAYGVTSIPTTYFIDKDGNIAAGAQGAIDEATLREGLHLIQ